VGKFDEATWRFFNAIGLSPTYLRNANRGMAAVDQQITYVRELYAGSIVSIYSRVTEVKPKRLVFIHEMMNDEIHEVAARTTLTRRRRSSDPPSLPPLSVEPPSPHAGNRRLVS